MVKLLLDSSNTSLSVGLSCGDELIDFVSYECWQSQSEHMIPEIDSLLKKHNIKREDIEGIIISIGPGSYTGVRIALTIAKVMALCLNVSTYPVSSLRILKNDKKPSICLINARSGRSYFGVYEGEKVLVEDCIKTNEEVVEYIIEHPEYSVCGNVKYLGYQNLDTNICKQMVSLQGVLEPKVSSLDLKPVYMKD